MSFPIALLTDDFAASTPAAAWEAAILGSAAMGQGSGQLLITLPSSTAGTHQGTYRSNATYDLTGDDFYWNIGTMVSTAVAATAYFQLYIDASNILYWRQVSNAITARTIIAGVEVQRYTATWSATTYKYLRIRESAGTVYWDSSTNGTTWTNRFSMANPFAVTSLTVQFAASCGNVASPGSLRIDGVNLILPAPSSTWRETTADWHISNRLRSVTLASDGGKQGVLVTADTMNETTRALGGTLRYFAGPLGSSSGGYLQCTEYASLALAQASAFTIPIDGRVDLSAQVDARYMRLYHRSLDASSHTIYEYMPRRLVQADDIEAETITAINIAANAITADKIFVIELSAISADMGTITAGTITGALIRTSESNPRVEMDSTSLRTYNSGGTNLVNVSTGTGGALEVYALNSLVFRNTAADATMRGRIGFNGTQFEMGSPGGDDIYIHSGNVLTLRSDVSIVSIPNTNTLNASGGINVGTATSAGTGQINTSSGVGIGVAVPSNVRLLVRGSDTSSSNYALLAQDSAAATLFSVRNDGAFVLGTAGATLGFYASGGSTKQTVTGAKGGNVALTNLMTALANLGLLVNSTT